MRIFVSYASERRQQAESLSLALAAEGHEVFFDRSSLQEGEAFNARIRRAIEACNLFVFLISPESIAPGSYTLSELEIMRKRTPVPGDGVLPVMVATVPIESVPNYLKAVTIMKPVGDLTADVLARVNAVSKRRRTPRRRLLGLAGVSVFIGTVAGGIGYWWLLPNRAPPEPKQATLKRGLSVFREHDQNSEIVDLVKPGEEITVFPLSDNPNWVQIRTPRLRGWAMIQDIVSEDADDKDAIKLGQGYGYRGTFWRLFFTSPQPNGKAPNTFGIDVRFADAIRRVERSLDMAIYEINNRNIMDAIIEVQGRGVNVRVVTDGSSMDRDKRVFGELMAAGIRVVANPRRGRLMHNKFAILDLKTVWTGSWNYTDGATYANNENAIVLEGLDIAERYQEVFNRMFVYKQFGSDRTKASDSSPPRLLGHGVKILFSPEDPILAELTKRIEDARRSVAILAFGFTSDDLAEKLRAAAQAGVVVRGLFEKSLARRARAVRSLCASDSGIQVRLDSNPRYLHHDVIVIDEEIVITGSLNFSRLAMTRNDENVVVIPDATLAKKYLTEFSRLWITGTRPDPASCAGLEE